MTKISIISNYNQNPESLLKITKDVTIIFDQSDIQNNFSINHQQSSVIKSKHTGHNLSDYFYYIINHYSSLPQRIAFLKSNMIGRHISKKIFLDRWKMDGFVSLYSDDYTYIPKHQRFRFISQQLTPGIYLERNNNWYCKSRPKGKYYPKFNDLFSSFFAYHPPRYIPFVPGGCMIVPSENILRWPLKTFKKLYEITTYDFFPVEAYHVERLMLYLFYFHLK